MIRRMLRTRAIRNSLGCPWAILEPDFRNVLAQAARYRADPRAFDVFFEGPAPEEGTLYEVRGSVAVVPIEGPIFQRGDALSRILGEATQDGILESLRAVAADERIRSTVLAIDSPGGAAPGLAEVAEAIRQLGESKPVVAVGSGQVASAAYFLASAAGEIVLSRDTAMGAIGTILEIVDFRRAMEAAGIDVFEFVSSQSPNKNPDPATEAGRAQIQALVDSFAAVFVAEVARGRGVSEETVLSDFGQGAQMVGEAAVTAGLADRIGTLDEVVAELGGDEPAPASAPTATGGGAMDTVRIGDITAEWLRQNCPQAAQSIEAAGRESAQPSLTEERERALRDEGARAENERILGILGHAQNVSGDVAAQEGLRCLVDRSVSADAAGGRLLRAQAEASRAGAAEEAERHRRGLEGLRAEEREDPAPDASEGDPDDEMEAFRRRTRSMGDAIANSGGIR